VIHIKLISTFLFNSVHVILGLRSSQRSSAQSAGAGGGEGAEPDGGGHAQDEEVHGGDDRNKQATRAGTLQKMLRSMYRYSICRNVQLDIPNRINLSFLYQVPDFSFQLSFYGLTTKYHGAVQINFFYVNKISRKVRRIF
jgi:hypothetical protein